MVYLFIVTINTQATQMFLFIFRSANQVHVPSNLLAADLDLATADLIYLHKINTCMIRTIKQMLGQRLFSVRVIFMCNCNFPCNLNVCNYIQQNGPLVLLHRCADHQVYQYFSLFDVRHEPVAFVVILSSSTDALINYHVVRTLHPSAYPLIHTCLVSVPVHVSLSLN